MAVKSQYNKGRITENQAHINLPGLYVCLSFISDFMTDFFVAVTYYSSQCFAHRRDVGCIPKLWPGLPQVKTYARVVIYSAIAKGKVSG